MIALLLMFQVEASNAGRVLEPIPFDLGRVKSSVDLPGSIIVTGRRVEHRLRDSAPVEKEPLFPRAEMKLFGDVRASVDAEQVDMGRGETSKRAMVKIKIPF